MNKKNPVISKEAAFNIGAVTRMTGIPTATLRAWEHRYGFPHAPVRTKGGHRLYSEQDVNLLRSVKHEIERGLSASQAVKAVLNKKIFTGNPDALLGAGDYFSEKNPAFSEMRAKLGRFLVSRETNKVDAILSDMQAVASPEAIILRVIGPVLSSLGEAWFLGDISVADEHFASNYLRQRLMMWLVSAPPPRDIAPILLACAPGEWHEGSLLMLAVLLRRRRWPVEYLGQNVPFKDLAAFVEQSMPSAVVMVAMQAETTRQMADWQIWIPQGKNRPLFTYGGRAFVIQPELREQIPGEYLGDDIPTGLRRLEELLKK